MSSDVDRLPSWNDGEVKSAIVDFVARSSDATSADFVAPADRVAAFDNDGTLWVEQPMPPQAPFLLNKLVEMVKADPSLAGREPFRSIVSQDPEFFAGVARQDPAAIEVFLRGIGEAWEGCSPEEYDAEVRAFVERSNDHHHVATPCVGDTQRGLDGGFIRGRRAMSARFGGDLAHAVERVAHVPGDHLAGQREAVGVEARRLQREQLVADPDAGAVDAEAVGIVGKRRRPAPG